MYVNSSELLNKILSVDMSVGYIAYVFVLLPLQTITFTL